MDQELVKSKIIEVLRNIQTWSGLECPDIVGTTKPIDDLPKFDSKIWPVAIGMPTSELGVLIPNDTNIFRRSDRRKTPMTIDETVNLVCQLIDERSPAMAPSES